MAKRVTDEAARPSPFSNSGNPRVYTHADW